MGTVPAPVRDGKHQVSGDGGCRGQPASIGDDERSGDAL